MCSFVKFLPILFTILVISCRPEEEQLTSNAVRLVFKNDTNLVTDSILFDTILAGQANVFPKPSISRRLKVLNPSPNAIKTTIRLANDGSSPYFLIINGIKQNSVEDFMIRGGDSIYIFNQVTPTNQNKNTPFLVQDSILFSTNGVEQRVILTTWGRDAIYYKGDSITTNATWQNDKIHFLFKSLIVSQNATLTIKKGTEIYATKGSSLIIKGSLKIEGDSGKAGMVRFQGPRTENFWENIPGQWKGIVFTNSSQNNEIKFVEIKNAENGIAINNTENQTNITFGEISNTIIKNMSNYGIFANNINLKTANSLVYNCGKQVLKIKNGGNYEFYNNTFANYQGTFSHDSASVIMEDNGNNLINLTIKNNIFWGSISEELILNKTKTENWTLIQESNAIKSSKTDFVGNGNIISAEKDFPQFQNISENNYNFRLKSTSPFIGKGVSIPFIINDITGKSRPTLFDIGAYQFYK